MSDLNLRRNLNRPLTYNELDDNFEYLESISGGGGTFSIIKDVTNVSGFTDGWILMNNTGVISELDPSTLIGSDEINVNTTVVNDGNDKKLFYNDNGVFKEIPNFEYDNINDVLVYEDNTRELGLIAGQQSLEVEPNVFMDFGSVGFFGKENYTQGYIDLTSLGYGLVGQLGFGNPTIFYGITAIKDSQDDITIRLNAGKNVSIQAESYVNINSEYNVNINAENNVSINAEEGYVNINAEEGYVNINAEEGYVNINAEEDVHINAEGDNSNLWANFGNENSWQTQISFRTKSVNGEYHFGIINGSFQFNAIDQNQNFDRVVEIDMLNKKTNILYDFQLGNNSEFGQYYDGSGVAQLANILESMGIITQ